MRKHAVPTHAKPAAPWRKKNGHQPDTHRIKIGVRFVKERRNDTKTHGKTPK
jgi:hypothetical protein